MIPVKIGEVKEFAPVEIAGRKALLSDVRISREDIPNGLYLYDLMEDENGYAAIIENHVFCNYYGTIIVGEEIPFENFYDISGLDNDEGLNYLPEPLMSLEKGREWLHG